MGVKFYDGVSELHPLMHVRLRRDCSNPADLNAVQVRTKAGKVLGHLERKVAALVAPIIDASLPGLKIKV